MEFVTEQTGNESDADFDKVSRKFRLDGVSTSVVQVYIIRFSKFFGFLKDLPLIKRIIFLSVLPRIERVLCLSSHASVSLGNGPYTIESPQLTI